MTGFQGETIVLSVMVKVRIHARRPVLSAKKLEVEERRAEAKRTWLALLALNRSENTGKNDKSPSLKTEQGVVLLVSSVSFRTLQPRIEEPKGIFDFSQPPSYAQGRTYH